MCRQLFSAQEIWAVEGAQRCMPKHSPAARLSPGREAGMRSQWRWSRVHWPMLVSWGATQRNSSFPAGSIVVFLLSEHQEWDSEGSPWSYEGSRFTWQCSVASREKWCGICVRRSALLPPS